MMITLITHNTINWNNDDDDDNNNNNDNDNNNNNVNNNDIIIIIDDQHLRAVPDGRPAGRASPRYAQSPY